MIQQIRCRKLQDTHEKDVIYYHWYKTQGPEIVAASITTQPALRFVPVRPVQVDTEFRFLVVGGDGELFNPNPQHVSITVLANPPVHV